jgi:hypothetical protein
MECLHLGRKVDSYFHCFRASLSRVASDRGTWKSRATSLLHSHLPTPFHRINVARALYYNADVVIFDDRELLPTTLIMGVLIRVILQL